MKKNYLKRMAGICATLLIAAWMLRIISFAVANKDAYEKYLPFIEDETEYDVLFFGSSHVKNGIYPMQLWRDYGITSYNLGHDASGIKAAYWTLVNATALHKPKVAVLDVFGCSTDTEGRGLNTSLTHNWLDAFPLCAEKVAGVNDMFPDRMDRIQMLFPFVLYHNNWSSVTLKDFFGKQAVDINTAKGAEYLAEFNLKAQNIDLLPAEETLSTTKPPEGVEYVRKFILYCKDNDIQPVLVYLPFEAVGERLLEMNTGALIAGEEGVPYLNMLKEGIVNLEIDSADQGSHLNPSGAYKVTDYLGDYLSRHYLTENHRTDSVYSAWEEDYAIYRENVLRPEIEKQNDFLTLLTQLRDEEFGTYLTLFRGTELSEKERLLVEQIPHLYGLEEGDETDNEHGCDIRLHLYDRLSGEEIAVREYLRYEGTFLLQE